MKCPRFPNQGQTREERGTYNTPFRIRRRDVRLPAFRTGLLNKVGEEVSIERTTDLFVSSGAQTKWEWRNDSDSGRFEACRSVGREKGFKTMNRSKLGLATIAAIVVAGCASVATQTAEQQSDKTVVTGSRLPARDGGSVDVKSTSNKNDISDIMQRDNRNNLPSMGGGK